MTGQPDLDPRPRWGRPPPILLAVLLAPISLGLGYAGYRTSDLRLTGTDALYASLQLFTVGGVIPTAQTPWQLDLARFLAPVAVVYAAVVAAVGLLRNRAERLRVRFVRHQVVVVGLGATGSEVVEGLRKAPAGQSGRRRLDVVALESDARNLRISPARARGVRVVIGDGTKEHYLRRAGVHRARHVVVLTGDDSRNLEVAAEVRRLLAKSQGRPLGLHVALSDVDLWRELNGLRLSAVTAGVVTEYVHLADRTAQRLLEEADRRTGDQPLDDVLVDGDTPVAVRTVVHLVRRGLLEGRRPRIHVSDAGLLQRVDDQEGWCRQHADLAVLDGAQPRVVLVCAPENADARAIARGLALARRHRSAAVLATVYRPRSETTLDAAGSLGRQVHLVSAKVDALGRELLQRSAVELMAQVRHDDYVRQARSRGETVATNSSLVSWEDLPDSLKESNRRFAEQVSRAIGDLGAELVPLDGPVGPAPVLEDRRLLDVLARGEHERWMQALRDDGWEQTDGPKDAKGKVHPLLVPWEELPEPEREKDRDAFRALPAMLGRIGYALVVRGSA